MQFANCEGNMLNFPTSPFVRQSKKGRCPFTKPLFNFLATEDFSFISSLRSFALSFSQPFSLASYLYLCFFFLIFSTVGGVVSIVLGKTWVLPFK